MDEVLKNFIFLWAVIDPFGTIPVFIAVTRRHREWDRKSIAVRAILVSAGILLFFIVFGQILLEAMGVPLSAFQISGGIVLFLFALTMIFGESKPEEESHIIESGHETAIFPLAVPSIASPGAMMAVVLMTDNHRFSVVHQLITTGLMLIVLLITLIMLLMATRVHRLIGDSGASILSRVMGLILCSVACSSILSGIQVYFNLG